MPSTRDAIVAYQDSVERSICDVRRCPRCGKIPKSGAVFTRHGDYERTILVVINRIVHGLPLTLIRWRCPACRKTFTSPPAFLHRHKHYAWPEMSLRAKRFLESAGETYRSSVTDSILPVYRNEGDVENSRTLAHTTVYRFITTVGGRPPPGPSDGSVARHKSKSPARAKELSACLQRIRGKP